jgi:hypothetical protein
MHLRRVRVVGLSFSAALMHDQSCYAAKLELELIKIQMAQKPMLRAKGSYHAASFCDTQPWRGPPAALPGADV